jgi:hypothetical protein
VSLIDENGRVFGTVNVVDAMIVLVVLTVAVAGVAFVLADGGSEAAPTETRYATLALGSQPPYVATLVTEGDVDDEADTGEVRITDVYATGADDGRGMYVRVAITGAAGEDQFVYGDSPLRVGRSLQITTDRYQVSGVVTDVAASGASLPVGTTDVLLRTTLPTETAESIDRDDEYRIGGRTIGTVRTVTAYGTGGGSALAYVGVTYRTYRSIEGPRFGDVPVREGASLPFATGAYDFEGEVVRRGALTQSGRATTRSVTLELESVDPDLAETLRVGMAERIRGTTVARITGLSVEPATVVLTSQDGNVYRREHPVNKDVTVTARLRVRETGNGVRFKGRSLRQGQTVVIDLGSVTIEPTLVHR